MPEGVISPEGARSPGGGEGSPPARYLGSVENFELYLRDQGCEDGPQEACCLTIEPKFSTLSAPPRRRTEVPWAPGTDICPGGELPTLAVDDFNFDGRLDFALDFDRSGPYGSLTYEVFLFRPSAGSYVRSPALSDLTTVHMGLFEVDRARRRLRASGKTGCCIHSWSEYTMHGEALVFTLSEVESVHSNEDGSCTLVTERTTPERTVVVNRRPCPPE